MGVISIYKDSKLQEKITFPPTKAGETSKISLSLRNNIGANVQIQEVVLTDPDVSVVEVSQRLDPTGKGTLVLEWSPQKDQLLPLNTKINLKELVG